MLSELTLSQFNNPLKTGDLNRGTLTNSEYPDEISQHATFNQGLHCLLSQNQSSEKDHCFSLENL